QSGQYDLVYLWDKSLDNVLDYQNRLEEILDPDITGNLRIVCRKQGDYGLIYDHNGTALNSAQLMVQHSEILRKAGLPECLAVEDQGYYQLYNVSYGLGPNLESMKNQYAKVYHSLGSEVGKNLFIEQTSDNNYTLIYRRRSDRSSTYKVARKHAKLLKRKGISTAIIAEKNNPVVFGESSHLDNATSYTKIKISAKKEPAQKIVSSEPKPKSKSKPAPKPEYRANTDLAEIVPTPSSASGKKGVEQAIESFIKELRRKGKISDDEKTGWMVYDLTKRESLVDINGELRFQAASMIKPFVALAFFHQAKQRELIYGPKSRKNMELMIQRSNNSSTNWIMRMAGGPSRCNEILQTYYSDIFKNTVITEYIPPGGKTYKNVALPSDYVRFLQALWDDDLPYSEEIRRLMSLPGRDRLYDNTPIPQGTLVYNKTGSTAYLCGDMGILVPHDKSGKRYPYALVGIIQSSSRPRNYGNWMLTRGNVIRQVSTLVYQEMKKQYHLL
ncbi:MAG: class A beta-lactamase-related serine hydrolase, partial [Proteobacteria bacterium]|nr:class A beta-lactamase-related serine hydrolase [Pseudomonadota bacterium]